MVTKVYTLTQNPTSKEYHLFAGEMLTVTGCSMEPLSLCGKMKKSDMVSTHKVSCLNEELMRTACANVGRQVCGTCISDLYWTKQKK